MSKNSTKLAIFDAIDNVDIQELESLIKTRNQANMNYRDQPKSLLCKAVCINRPNLVQVLLAKGANPNTLFNGSQRVSSSYDGEGWFFSPLATAVRNEYFEITMILIQSGAKIDLPCSRSTYNDRTSGYAIKTDLTVKDVNREFVQRVLDYIALLDQAATNPVQKPGELKSL